MSDTFVFVECTTPAKSKRHWSLQPTAQWGLNPLCNTTPRGLSQADVDDQLPPRWRKRVVIADLPPCRQCDKSRARRIDGRSS